MKVLVTGATGFLGKQVLTALSGRGHEVTGTSRTPVGDLRRADLLDTASLTDTLAGQDAVVHCAGGVEHAEQFASAMHQVHVEGTENLLSAAREAGVKRFVYVSTSGTIAVSTQPEPVADESAPSTLPLVSAWPYYRSKVFAEELVLAAGSDSLETLCVNPSLLLGPDAPSISSVDLVARFLTGGVAASPPGGLSFVDVRDAAEGIARALEEGRPGERYLLSTVNMSFSEFFERLARLDEASAPAVRLPRAAHRLLSFVPERIRERLPGADQLDARELEMASHFWYADSSKARRELSWAPRDPGQTLDETVRDLRSRGLVAS